MSTLAQTVDLQHGASGSSRRYMPGLDVVRGVAIAMVLVYHGMAADTSVAPSFHITLVHALNRVTDLGGSGVFLFFVLSGFLITGILLSNRSKPDYYRSFYLRRAARILPAGLMILLVLKLGNWISWRYLLAALLYVANTPRLLGAGSEYGPLWSLSVEEQFYLVWPFVVRRCSARNLALVSMALVAFTPALRYWELGPTVNWDRVAHKTYSVCDFFATGALIALAAQSARYSSMARRAMPWLIGVGLALATGYALLSSPERPVVMRVYMAYAYEPWLVLGAGVVLFAIGHPALASSLFGRCMVFLAKISYGLYLCHLLIFDTLRKYWPINIDGSYHSLALMLARFSIGTGVSIAIAAVSRWTVEEYFLKLKAKPAPQGA